MTIFLRLLTNKDKANALLEASHATRTGDNDERVFHVQPEAFKNIPSSPFAYWVSEAVRAAFLRLPAFAGDGRMAKQGLATAEDFRFVRTWWELVGCETGWHGFAKGGAYSQYYADVYLAVNWKNTGAEIKAGICKRYPYLNGNPDFVAKNTDFYGRPGLTWSLRSQLGISLRVMPMGCIFGHKGPAAFVSDDTPDEMLGLIAISNSRAFGLLVSLQMAFGSYEVGVIQRTPVPDLLPEDINRLATLSRRAWSLKRSLDIVEETSHAFLLPTALRVRLGDYVQSVIEAEMASIQTEIDAFAFDLYGFAETDRHAVNGPVVGSEIADADTDDDDEDENVDAQVPSSDALLSWAVGVSFGRFDWRLATGERIAPPDPEPFDPLPAKSPGMLPDGAEWFHSHSGILVDDQGHPHDLAHLIEEVLGRVDVPIPDDVRRWLQRDFFAFHLQRYSKSRRKAPIYWPLDTASGSYTLWVYYPSLTSQTLYVAINDFVEPKLKEVGAGGTALRNKGTARTRDEEKQFETLQAFELELIELRDTLLGIAPGYQPNHDDGVQITAAPLWPLFRHKPWQKILKDTWAKLEKGDYDWAHLAMNYWPDRVREKCKTDKSLAIAHGLEDLYIEPETKVKKTRGKKTGE